MPTARYYMIHETPCLSISSGLLVDEQSAVVSDRTGRVVTFDTGDGSPFAGIHRLLPVALCFKFTLLVPLRVGCLVGR